MKQIFFITLISYFITIDSISAKVCNKSVTTTSGSKARKNFCSGEIIFEDKFDSFDSETWQRENTFSGFGNDEFEWYTNDPANSFTKNSSLFIKPTLTSDYLGSDSKLYSATIDLGSACSTHDNNCKRTGTKDKVINPVRSARMKTYNSFRFKYGIVEIRAQMPSGDWLWPALWFLPYSNHYGGWPTSGEIDLAESRGNAQLWQNGKNIGSDEVASTLHWGPDSSHDAYPKTSFPVYRPSDPFSKSFRRYQLEWTPDHIKFSIDDQLIKTVDPGKSFWDYGEFAKQEFTHNPWAGGSKMAPFDQEFYIIINLAIGGNFFPDDAVNKPYPKPWKQGDPLQMTKFWQAKDEWYPTWKPKDNNEYDASLKVDYVRVWAL